MAATDDDHGSDGVIVYTIIDGNLEQRFQIDPNSGIIKLRKQLDRETTEMYSLSVQATDQGAPNMSSTAVVNVTILDVNDNAPLCSHASYVIEMAENFTVNNTVVSLQCSDADHGHNAVISYNISSGKKKYQSAFDLRMIKDDLAYFVLLKHYIEFTCVLLVLYTMHK